MQVRFYPHVGRCQCYSVVSNWNKRREHGHVWLWPTRISCICTLHLQLFKKRNHVDRPLKSGRCWLMRALLDKQWQNFLYIQGGLSMKLEDFTWPLATSGAALALFALTMYARLVKRWGPILLCRIGLSAGALPAMLLPFASLVTSFKPASLVSLTLDFQFLKVSYTVGTTDGNHFLHSSVFQLDRNSVYKMQDIVSGTMKTILFTREPAFNTGNLHWCINAWLDLATTMKLKKFVHLWLRDCCWVQKTNLYSS